MRVEPDDRFERRGEELWHSVEVGIAEATLGKEIKVPLVDGGSHLFEIPAGTQPGSVFRISKEGMPKLQRRGRGDLVVQVDVRVPLDVSAEEEDLLRSFAELQTETPSPQSRRRRKRGR
jgi:molecular chaperone DnaJ